MLGRRTGAYFPASLELAVLVGVPGLLTLNGFDIDPGALDVLETKLGELGPHARACVEDFPCPVPAFTFWPCR
ncbi:hypothetical protein [Amycolatopsis sp. cmx-11-32]|uniref:hypothetical protein n=1 Tax=Amycolatopsis sp. cmx-11-32 TaxID=2785796 RepID=UPI0039E30C28